MQRTITPVKEGQTLQKSNLILLSQNIFKPQISIQILKRMQTKIRETELYQRPITSVKVDQVWQNQTWSELCQYLKRQQRKDGKTKFQQRAITPVKVGQAWRNSHLICFMSRQIHMPNFKSISQKMAVKSSENLNSAKGNNSCKRRSSVTKLGLDLYYDKKEEIWPSPMTKAPTPTETPKGQVTTQTNTNNATKKCQDKFTYQISSQ